MTDEDWLSILNSEENAVEIVLHYCLYKGKSEQDTVDMLKLVSIGALALYGITINSLAYEAINNICMELDFIELRDKEERLIKFYKNQQTNGKEIFKV